MDIFPAILSLKPTPQSPKFLSLFQITHKLKIYDLKEQSMPFPANATNGSQNVLSTTLV